MWYNRYRDMATGGTLMINIALKPPPGFIPANKPRIRAELTLDSKSNAQGRPLEKMAFHKNYGLMQGLLHSLKEPWCTGSIAVRISNSSAAVDGHLAVWDSESRTAIIMVVNEIADCAAALARHPQNTAEFLCEISRTWKPRQSEP